MKHIKKFNEELYEKSIKDWCGKFELYHYTINENDVVDVDENVNLRRKELGKIPIQFGIVEGYFCCDHNNLTSLRGCARVVNGNFWCKNNKLVNLIGGPIEVNGDYDCESNNLISLEGISDKIKSNFWCSGNYIYEVYRVFGNIKKYKDSLDYNYLIGRNIIRLRFEEACEEAGIKMPESIMYYKYI